MSNNPFTFTRAERANLNIRVALSGPTGSGKTFTALALGTRFAESEKTGLAVIDTERSSSDRYADRFSFDRLNLTLFTPENYIGAIKAAEQAGYRALVIDSLSHSWEGVGGMLEVVDAIAAANRGQSFQAWAKANPIYRKLLDTMLGFNGHIIATLRSKTEWALETNERGKNVPRKIGTKPIMRDGIEYEFDHAFEMDTEHNLTISKTRDESLDGRLFNKPGVEFADALVRWAKKGRRAPAPASTPEPELEGLRAATKPAEPPKDADGKVVAPPVEPKGEKPAEKPAAPEGEKKPEEPAKETPEQLAARAGALVNIANLTGTPRFPTSAIVKEFAANLLGKSARGLKIDKLPLEELCALNSSMTEEHKRDEAAKAKAEAEPEKPAEKKPDAPAPDPFAEAKKKQAEDAAKAEAAPASGEVLKKIGQLCEFCGKKDKEAKVRTVSMLAGRSISKSTDLTAKEAKAVLGRLRFCSVRKLDPESELSLDEIPF